MRRYLREDHERDYRAGMRALAAHRPDLALRRLRSAAGACPATSAGELSRDLYWLAHALLRLDKPELALKSLASAQKLRPRSRARDLYLARSNAYGMCRRATPELDDFYAFYSAQACGYLSRKSGGRFGSNAEKDAVTRLIGDAWRTLLRSGKLEGLSAPRKLDLFSTWHVSFPIFGIEPKRGGVVVAADFRRGRRLSGEDRCSCGSGLPYIRCCGRGSSLIERSCE